jgi:hypothetical protein
MSEVVVSFLNTSTPASVFLAFPPHTGADCCFLVLFALFSRWSSMFLDSTSADEQDIEGCLPSEGA